jgi:hypothetical protein
MMTDLEFPAPLICLSSAATRHRLCDSHLSLILSVQQAFAAKPDVALKKSRSTLLTANLNSTGPAIVLNDDPDSDEDAPIRPSYEILFVEYHE